MQLKAGNNYTMACEAPGYLPANQIKVSLENANGTETINNTIEMMPVNIAYSIQVLGPDNKVINNAPAAADTTTVSPGCGVPRSSKPK